MKEFFRSFLASSLAVIIAGLIAAIIFAAIVGGAIQSALGDLDFDKGGKTKVTENTVLQIQLDDQISERKPGGSDFAAILNSEGVMGLDEILENIEWAKTDSRIEGIMIDVTMIPAGWATLEEVRNALIDFKASGKWVIAYSEYYTHSSYYLASVADEIYLYPEGGMVFQGYHSELAFVKGMLEKLEIDMQIIRGSNNKFKSAVEPLINTEMSDANREQTLRFLTTMWNHMISGISEERGISVDELNIIADSVLLRTADDAVTYGLVDGVMYKDELLANIDSKLELAEEEEVNMVTLAQYIRSSDYKKRKHSEGEDDEKKDKPKNEVAVVYCVGGIESGDGDDMTIGSERISQAIRDARLDDDVKAIVLRVNSPGGSALASDVIWREVVLAQEVKPVVVSMGDVAASGGYYISCAADYIFAQPNTITGSIGVFGVLPNMQGFWNNKLGVTFDGVGTNDNSNFGSLNRPLTDEEFKLIQEGVDDIYGDFIGKVADGRGMTPADVDSIGQGRVWSGVDAIEIGLVDELGGLEDAIAYAANLAELEDGDYKTTSLPEQEENPFMEIMAQMEDMDARTQILEEIGVNDDMLMFWQYATSLKNMEGYQARMPYYITIE